MHFLYIIPYSPTAAPPLQAAQQLWALVEGLGGAVLAQAGGAADPAAARIWRQGCAAMRQLPPGPQRQRLSTHGFWEQEVAGALLPALKRLAARLCRGVVSSSRRAPSRCCVLRVRTARAPAPTPAARTCGAPARGGCGAAAVAAAVPSGTAARSARGLTGRNTVACAARCRRRQRREEGVCLSRALLCADNVVEYL